MDRATRCRGGNRAACLKFQLQLQIPKDTHDPTDCFFYSSLFYTFHFSLQHRVCAVQQPLHLFTLKMPPFFVVTAAGAQLLADQEEQVELVRVGQSVS